MEHDCTTESVAGATLVAVRVRNDAPVPRRVRVRNELPGPVLPPRREGVTERGWDAEGFEGVLDPGEERALGYACPVASEDEHPISVASLGRVDGDGETDRENEAIRALGRARPPADAVPVPDASFAPESPSDGDVREPPESDASEGTGSEADADGRTPKPRPPAVDSWLDAVERRVRLAERLTDAAAADAVAALETAGDVSGLAATVAADEETLRAVAARADELADRAAETDAGPVVAALVDS